MLVSSKQKKAFNITLIIAMISILFLGIGLGVFFIIRSKGEGGLSVREITFGNKINKTNMVSTDRFFDMSKLPPSVDADAVVDFTDDYVVILTGEGLYSVYNFKTGEYSPVSVNVNFDEYVSVYGDTLIVKDHGVTKITNLITGINLCTLTNGSFIHEDGYLLLKAKYQAFNFLDGNISLSECGVIVFNVETFDVVYTSLYNENIIDVELQNDYLVVTKLESTEIYQINSSFKKVKSFVNVGSVISDGYNIKSSINTNKYQFTKYNRVYSVGGDNLFVENAQMVTSGDYDLIIALTGGPDAKYNISYKVFNVKANKSFDVKTDNEILKVVDIDVDNYFAVLSSSIKDKKIDSVDDQQIKYYQVDKNNRNKYVLSKIVEYNYDDYGLVVGFTGKKLITSGAPNSTFINFNGDPVGVGKNNKISGISSLNYNDVIIARNNLGQSLIYDVHGNKIFDQVFDAVSPFVGKHAVGLSSDVYYRLSIDGEIEEIPHFDNNYEDYVFLGLGMYVTYQNGEYNLFSFDGTKIHSGNDINVRANAVAQELMITIIDDVSKIIATKPINANNIGVVSGNFNYELSVLGGEKSFNQEKSFVQNLISANQNLVSQSIDVDSITGIGSATYKLELNLSDVAGEFKSYEDLTAAELALIPTFDNVENMAYESFSNGATNMFKFDGAYYVTGYNFAIVVIRLFAEFENEDLDESANDQNFYYLVNFALKDAYINTINATTKNANSEDFEFMKYCIDGYIKGEILDCSNDTLPAISLQGGMLTYSDTAFMGKTLSYVGSGYDGGIVFVSNLANLLSFEFTLNNAYQAKNVSSDEIVWADLSPSETTFDCGKYNVVVYKSSSLNLVTIKAKEGYFITSLKLTLLDTDPSITGALKEVASSKLNQIITDYQIDLGGFNVSYECVKIQNVNIVESYSYLTLNEIQKTEGESDQVVELKRIYSYYGYGSDITAVRNPAYLGFNNFERLMVMDIPTKAGYEFEGYEVDITIEDDGDKAINRNGRIDETIFRGFVVYLKNSVKTNKLYVDFDPETYDIFYVSEGVEIPNKKEVTFDLVVGELFDVVNSIYNKKGYNFVGWYNNEGVEFTQDTIYTKVGDTILEARWTPKTYTVEFDSNLSTYNNLELNGYIYNIASVEFASGYDIFNIGDNFVGSLTKTIEFDSTYGDLPELVAYNSDGSQKYIFAGWFTEKGVSVSGENIVYSGKQITNITMVDEDPPVLKLYAHYIRQTYYIDLLVTGDNEALNAGVVSKTYKELMYDGSTAFGQKSHYSTEVKEGFETWVGETNANGEKFRLYALQGSNVQIQSKTGVGYYVQTITVKLYDSEGNATQYEITGNWSNLLKDNYTLSGDVSILNIFEVKNIGFNVDIELFKINNAFLHIEGLKNAEIEIVYGTKKFNNEFIVSAPEGQNVTAEIVNKDLIQTENNYVVSDIIYGYNNSYEVRPETIENLSGEVVNKSRLKEIIVDGDAVLFTYNFEQDEDIDIWFHDLTTDELTKSTTWDADYLERTEIYEIGNVELVIKFNIVSKSYSYLINVVSEENHSIEVVFEQISTNISFVTNNLSDESSVTNGVNVSGVQYISAEAEPEEIGLLNDNVLTTSTLVWTINPNSNVLISSVIINYGDVEIVVARPKLKVSGDLEIVQSANYLVTTQMFNKVSSVAEMISTGLKIVWDEDARGFEITVSNVGSDVSITVNYMQFSLIQLAIQEEGLDAFELLISSGNELLVGQNLLNIAQEIADGSKLIETQVEKVYYYYDNYRYNIIITGSETSITSLQLKTTIGDIISYMVEDFESIPEDKIVVNAEKNIADINLLEIEKSLIDIKSTAGYVELESYLGVGANNFEKDPLDGFGILSNVEMIYYNESAELDSEKYNASTDKILFVGSMVKFRIYEIVGYYYYEASLNNEDGVVAVKEVVDAEDANGKYKEFIYEISDFSKTEFVFKSYQKAIEYTIKYDANNNGKNIATGNTADSYHVYNVFTNLSENDFERTGYSFLGFAKTAGASIADYQPSQKLEENLTFVDGGEVVLYAVWSTETYTINYVLNDVENNNGSSPSEFVINGTSQVVFDSRFGGLAVVDRQGYIFNGWFSGSDLETEIKEGDLFDINKHAIIDVSDESKTIELYAKYTAIEYNLTIKTNDKADVDGFGSTTSVPESSIDNIKVTYDSEFTLPTLNRIGYDFLGYKSVRLLPSEVDLNVLNYIGLGEAFENAICYDIASEDSGYNLEIDDDNKTLILYAVYKPQTFRAYVNLNNKTLNTYGTSDGVIEIIDVDTFSEPYTDYYIEVVFDSAIGELPEIKLTGYYYQGLYIVPEFDSEVVNSANKIDETMVLNYDLFESLLYTNSGDVTVELSEAYELGGKYFSLYAHYLRIDYLVEYNAAVDENYNESGDKYTDYDYKDITSVDGLKTDVEVEINEDIVLDILTNEGYYYSSITIGYPDHGATKTHIINFIWNKNQTITTEIDGVKYNKINQFIEINNIPTNVAEAIFVKVLPYNDDGSDLTNIVSDACRVIIAFHRVKTRFTVDSTQSLQKYDIEYYRYYKSGYESYGLTKPSDLGPDTIEVVYGSAIRDIDLDYIYTPSFKFINWYYGELGAGNVVLDPTINTGNLAHVGDVVTNNVNLTALYEVSLKQLVNFYFWDKPQNAYVLRTDLNELYILREYKTGSTWVGGEYNGEHYSSDEGIGGGRLISLPSTANSKWPDGTYCTGFVITNSAPASGYYSDSNIVGLQEFDLNVMVEEELNVFAVYNPTKFDLEVKSEGSSLKAKSDFSIYETLKDGSVKKYTYRDLYYVSLTESQYQIYCEYMAKENEVSATALRAALGGNLIGAKQFESEDYFEIATGSGGNLYIFAFTIRQNNSGQNYIYQVANNYYTYVGGTLNSVSTN